MSEFHPCVQSEHEQLSTCGCRQREGGAGSREGGEVNHSALSLTHFLTPVKVSSQALPCHMLTNGAPDTIAAIMGLCYSEKRRKFAVLKSWREVSQCKGFALRFNAEGTDSSVYWRCVVLFCLSDWLVLYVVIRNENMSSELSFIFGSFNMFRCVQKLLKLTTIKLLFLL